MSKRARPLSAIEWSLLDPRKTKSARFEQQSAVEEENDEEEEEEPTVHIDQGEDIDTVNQQHGMAILNSMMIDKRSINDSPARRTTTKATVQDQVPRVSLDSQFNKTYNKSMNERFPPTYNYESSEEDLETDIFNSLGSGGSRSPLSMSISDSPQKQQPERRREKARRLVQSPAYDTEERAECFLCSWGNRYHDGIRGKHVNALKDILATQYPRCNNLDLAQQLHIYFKKYVYKPRCGMTMLTREIALEHIENPTHTLNATFFQAEGIRKCMRAAYVFENAICKADGGYDIVASKEFREYLKEARLFYKLKPEEMAFNYGLTQKDTHEMGNPINIMPEMKQVREKDKRRKLTEQLITTNETFNRGLQI